MGAQEGGTPRPHGLCSSTQKPHGVQWVHAAFLFTADTPGGWRGGLLESARVVLEGPTYPCREPGSCLDLEVLPPTTLRGIPGCRRKSSLGSVATQHRGVKAAALLQPLGTVPTPCLCILGRLGPKVGAQTYSSSRNGLFHLPTSTHTQPHTYIHTHNHTQPHTHNHTHIHTTTHTTTCTYTQRYTQPHTHTHRQSHTHMHTHTITHTQPHTYIHTYTQPHTTTCTYTQRYTQSHTHTITHIHTYNHIHTITHTYIYTQNHTHTYIQPHTHNHTHTYIHTITHT